MKSSVCNKIACLKFSSIISVANGKSVMFLSTLLPIYIFCSWSCVFITKLQIKYNVCFFFVYIPIHTHTHSTQFNSLIIQKLSAADENHVYSHALETVYRVAYILHTQIHHKVQFVLILICKWLKKRQKNNNSNKKNAHFYCELRYWHQHQPLMVLMWESRRLYRRYKCGIRIPSVWRALNFGYVHWCRICKQNENYMLRLYCLARLAFNQTLLQFSFPYFLFWKCSILWWLLLWLYLLLAVFSL